MDRLIIQQFSADPHQIDREAVLLAERGWNSAILARDVARARSFMAPEYQLILGITGQPLRVISLGTWLAMLPDYCIHEHHTDDIHVSFFIDIAICTLSHRQIADPVNGRDICGDFLLTDIWVRRDGRWFVAERHSSRLESAPCAEPQTPLRS